ncbi:fructosamine kinase [Carbonactinospora thermoautotrophica]|uniref:Fructosamine kinase n=2 Tax=Carbonactinospora thermoautotrophica TaxID=1469144 RepID=A0A132MKZ7_9ACTN|nr:fructosamine kinase family protein [Carbonactinospora thermoautotrophica]KWW97835.1 fructosamine kinase [Carbonactinospora thermoautotrophica]KWW98425.1 Fructosamine kinase [Carbonactinospora thermoautotrophica]
MIGSRLERLLGVRVREVQDLGMNHRWRLHRAVLADGRPVFVKSGKVGALFAAEAAGLRWLGEAGAVPVPQVLAVDEETLVLPWLESEPATAPAAERFGRELAALHAAGAESFGASWPGFIAELPMDNTPGSSWPSWYAERRVLPFLRAAVDRGGLSKDDARLVERVVERIEALAGPAEPPSRIHGDCWSGNVLWAGGRGWLVDPAAHGGHRETDLAMLALFGAPFLDRILAAYQEVSPLADGWRARVPLHQLHPLLVHVVLFGRGYRSAVVEAARAALAAG